ncbi:MAG: efflux RND transporter permease subunit [Acidimicrobiia bacterium]|nr:efflux RND transporter permease subunit [Acidimicrobiia bacterium]
MKRLIQWSIDHHWMVLALSVVLAVAGVLTARSMPVDVFPDLTAPTVTVLTEGRGMAPEEMETLVTFPIEAAINGAPDVRRVRSATAVGIAVVWVEFDWGTDIFLARQLVAEKLALVSGSLPPQVERPVLAPVSSIMGEILFFAISSAIDDPLELRTVADTVVRRRLLAVPGVSQVTPIGGAERQFQVVAHPDQLRANGVTVTELLDAVRGASENTSAGIFMEGPQEYVLQTIGRARTPADIADTVVALRGGRSVLVRDVADVREGAALKRGEGSRSGRPAVIVGVLKQPGANTVELTARLDAELDALQQELPRGMTIDRRIFRQADFIEVAVQNVVNALRDGGLLVVVIVVLFLANLRAAAITLTAMPLSLAAAVLVLRAFDATINTMTLGGMAIAIGALVDDAIVDVENVVRRLRENAARPEAERASAAAVVRDATLEIRTSIVFATVIIVLVFLPVFGLTGVEGRLLTPLAVAYIVALLASLAVAIVVTPALAYAFLPGAASIMRGHDGWLARTLKGRFEKDLPRALDHPRLVMAASALLLAAALVAMTRFGSAFLPEFNEGTLTVQANTLPGTSLATSDELGKRVEQILLDQPEVVATARRTGRAEYDEHVQGVEAAEIDVGLRETGRPREELLADLRRGFAGLPGVNVTIGQPISHRIDHMLSGTRANIAVKIVGEDLPTLRRLGEQVREAMMAVPGAVDVSLEQQTEVPVVRFVLNRPAIARYGLRPAGVAQAVETGLAGAVVGRIFDRGAAFDLVVKFDTGAQADFERLADLPIDTPGGGTVPIRVLADVRREVGPNMILRENVQRRIVVSANVAGRDLGSVVDDMRAAVGRAVPMPAGYRVEYGGQFESEESAARRLLVLGGGVIVGVFLLLVLAFGRPRDALIVMVNLPLALIGGVAGVSLAGGVLSVASMIGFITLFGIATRNGIMLVSHIQHLMQEEGVTDFRQAVERGARERLVPILMTAMAAGLALIPLALGGGRPGSEIQTPMAIVILCGLMSSTLLNMIVVPTIYLRYARPSPVPEPARAAAPAGDPGGRHAPFAPPPFPVRNEG